MTQMTIACVGEAMLELQLTQIPGEARLAIAGDVLNTAVYLQRLMPQSRVRFVTVLGTDSHSESIKTFAANEALDVSSIVQIEDRLAGLYAITTDAAGERSFTYWRNQSAARKLFQTDRDSKFETLADIDALYLTAITLAIISPATRQKLFAWISDFRKAGGKFIFDSNFRPRLWENKEVAKETVAKAWSLCDIALPSIDDELSLFGETAEDEVLRRFANYPQASGALKRGLAGPRAINQPKHPKQDFASIAKVVDSTGAGDGFNAGYLATLWRTGRPLEAMTCGHELAMKIVKHRGAIIEKGKLANH